MDRPFSPRRLAENEVFFRQKNRDVEASFDTVKQMADADDQESFLREDGMLLQFYCECSDENCRERIPLTHTQYDAIHKAHDRFVIIRGHEVPEIEKLVEQGAKYCVIQKKLQPPETVSHLNQTPIDNTK